MYPSCDFSLFGWGQFVLYPSHLSLSVLYSFGFLVGVVFSVQVFTGFLLACVYLADFELTFSFVDFMMRDGDLLLSVRFMHSVGATVLFLFLFLHLGRSVVFGVSSRVHVCVWVVGWWLCVVAFGCAFLGYVLPFGLMSFWALVVVSNVLSVLPWCGQDILVYLLGGSFVSGVCLVRFSILHFSLPVLVFVFMLLHLWFLHSYGSGCAGGVLGSSSDKCSFFSFYYLDVCCSVLAVCVFACLVFVFTSSVSLPSLALSVDRYFTPRSIIPE